MTHNRQDEIWALLDANTQEWIKEQYDDVLIDIALYKEQNTDNGYPIMENRAIGQKQMLIRLFGTHNLTAQAKDKPKEPNCTNPTENGISDSKIQSKSAKSVETSTKEDAYFNYRLELTKEITVAMIGKRSIADFIPYDSVQLANKIVKRLKETEE